MAPRSKDEGWPYGGDMAVISREGIITDASLLRITLNTTPNLSAEECHRILGALLDEVALGYALLSPHVSRLPPGWRSEGEGSTLINKPGAQLEGPETYITVSPSFQILETIRTNTLEVRRLNYSNPWELVLLIVGATSGLAGAIAGFVSTMNLLTANRHKAEAEASLAEAQAAKAKAEATSIEATTRRQIRDGVLESLTLEVSLEEKRLLLQKARKDLGMPKEQPDLGHASSQALANQQFRDAREARRSIIGNVPATGRPGQWSDTHLDELFSNNRLIGSVELMSDLAPILEVIAEYDI